MEKVSDRELKKLINLLGVSKVRWLWLDEKLTLTQRQINEIIGLDGDIKSKEKVYLTGEQFQRICEIYKENLELKEMIPVFWVDTPEINGKEIARYIRNRKNEKGEN